MKQRPHIPIATYRLQLNRDFTFAQATEIVPYLSALGISHCYLSPCLKARPGSMHGYDIVDHSSFNPEIGTAEDFDHLIAALHEYGMGTILDLVPNHMGIMGSDNAWWLDVLENGQSSAYAGFFDIDWQPLKSELQGKVLIAILADHYGAVLESGELKVVFRAERGEFDIWYHNDRFPIDPREYPRILQRVAEGLVARSGIENLDILEFQSLITAFRNLPRREELGKERTAERNRDKEIHKRRLAEICARSAEIAAGIEEAVISISGVPGEPASFEDLHELIKAQTFRLANWRVASDDINYRRFFDTNDLAAICMEKESVFEATHRFVLDLMAQGKVDGFRIDHPDGLYDPAEYFERLRRRIPSAAGRSEGIAAEDASRYVVIEKILTGSEELPPQWPVQGTTGYEFANEVNGLFVNPAAVKHFEHIYRNVLGHEVDIDDLFYSCRKLIMRVALASELNVLANQLSRIALSKRRTCDFTLNSVHDALTEIVASFPVYRTYIVPYSVGDRDAAYIADAIILAKWRSPAADTSIFDFAREVLLTRIADGQDEVYRNAIAAFAMRFQQFTGPVMAKGLEDTAFYRYNRLVSLNDVGGDLHKFGITPAEFHATNQSRCRDWPHTMLATSTHDSKRSEDVRARINVLSEIAGLWRLHLRNWKRHNRRHKRSVDGKLAPAANAEYLLYQTLVGAWPSYPIESRDDWKTFSKRIEDYMLKALREAKLNTSWINRNAAYEDAVAAFVRALLTPGQRNKFLADFIPFQRQVARFGLWNGLSQTLLKLTCPGVPDIYQGNDMWDFSLVDPDNRRPVDYDVRRQAFASMQGICADSDVEPSFVAHLLLCPEDGRLKMYLIWRTLCLRREQPELFSRGEYLPLQVEGDQAQHVVAFERRFENTVAVVIVPRLIAGLLGNSDQSPIGSEVWGNTHVLMPEVAGSAGYRNVFAGEKQNLLRSAGQYAIELAAALRDFPVAVCLLK